MKYRGNPFADRAVLSSLVNTFREANAQNAPKQRAENEARIARLEEAIKIVIPFLS